MGLRNTILHAKHGIQSNLNIVQSKLIKLHVQLMGQSV